ncbi:MAG: LamG domain-containing protein [Steroidobacteraceae bacterium]
MRLFPLVLVLLLGTALDAPVARAADYTPDVMEFDGSGGMAFATEPILTLPAGGTLEFWVAADWQDSPGYDPILFANAGSASVAWQVAISADRQSLLVRSGTQEGRFAADFRDGRTHHVGIIAFSDETYVLIDGNLAAAVAMTLQEVPTDALWVGAGYGNTRPFTGAIAGLRVWDVALEPEELVAYALRDITSADAGHPDIDSLVGHSRFGERDFYITDAIVVSDADLGEEAP